MPVAAPGPALMPLASNRPAATAALLRLGVEDRLQQLIEVVGRNALGAQRILFADQAFVDQVDGDAHGGETGALGVARLQHPDFAALDGELDVLHVL